MLTVATAHVIDHNVIAPVGQQLYGRVAPVWLAEHPETYLGGALGNLHGRGLEGMQVRRSGFRYTLLQKQHAGLELWIGCKAPLHGLVQQHSTQS